MPGLVGLVLIDCFVAGVPLITTDNNIHSPEIAYLQNGVNGVMTSFDENIYAQQVVALLKDRHRLIKLQKGCRETAKLYTLDNMAINFVTGVERCLNEVHV